MKNTKYSLIWKAKSKITSYLCIGRQMEYRVTMLSDGTVIAQQRTACGTAWYHLPIAPAATIAEAQILLQEYVTMQTGHTMYVPPVQKARHKNDGEKFFNVDERTNWLA